MEEAEEALRRGDLDGALDRQAEAMEAMRDGMQNFGEALAKSSAKTATVRAARISAAPTPTAAIPWAANRATPRASDRTRTWCRTTRTHARRNCWTKSAAARATLARPGEELDYLKRLLQLF